ncbi:GumC family protein [Gymnodinialimonas ulvae]|uniref:GumC family protein n=1 Tax=Gymnodinialimonas ulvae TaxID=3126504 RepID=UPI00309F8393
MSTHLRFYWHLLIRRMPVMAFLVVVTAAAGLFFAAGLPTTYVSQARLLVQGQSISEDLATSTVQIEALEEVQLLREQVLTRANMIEIATRLNVFEDLANMTPTQVYDNMRRATTVNTQGGATRRGGGSPVLLTFEFTAREAQIAADVLNEYVTQVLAASVRLRTGQAGETLSFFEQEVQRLGDALERRSTLITEFQRENADALPDDQDFRLQRQSLLQERLAAAERERRELIDTRERTIQIFETGTQPQVNLPPDQQLLQELEAELSEMLLVFSETSTRVQILQRRIDRLEERIALQAAGTTGTEETPPETEESEPIDPLLALQLAEIDTRIEALDNAVVQTEQELETLNDAIARSPLNAIQQQRLERDYENVQLQFENARRALAQASIGERLEVGGRGQRITLLEPPVVPSRPASPNRRLFAVGSVGAGLALALAFFVLMELLNRSVRRPTELVKALGVTPFATLPNIETAGSRLLRRSFMLVKLAVLVIGVPAALWAVNEFYMPLDQLSERLLTRFGLA